MLVCAVNVNAQHRIPKSIEKEAKIALAYYPKLADTPIHFKFKKHIQKSTMQAQPKFWGLFGSKKKRGYKILISERIKIADTLYQTKDIPPNIMVGWLAHELGHIMDFKDRSGSNLIGFGMRYIFSKNYVMTAEREADTYAVAHGMEEYILDTKTFILEKGGLTQEYVDRIRELYLSPKEIMELVEERDSDLDTEALEN